MTLADVDDNFVLMWIVTAAGVLTGIFIISRKVWPTINNLNTMLRDWNGEPPRKGVKPRPGVMERLQSIEEESKSANFNSKPNHGTSAYDQLHKRFDEMDKSFLVFANESRADRAALWRESRKNHDNDKK